MPDLTSSTSATRRLRDRGALLLRWLRGQIDRWWYLPCLAVLAALDMFVWIVPTDFLVITATLLRPARRSRIVMLVALGSALGMFAFACGIELGGPVFRRLFELTALKEVSWTDAQAVASRNGPWALFLVAANPFLPPQPAIAVGVLTGMQPAVVFIAGLLGRLCKYAVYALLASRAPRLLRRWTRRG
ncbi:MAG: hypothetical protein ABSF50_12930 [Burkholderiaceae bacterium]|jgi:membrane protein YqaA with SNARE-associated domain